MIRVDQGERCHILRIDRPEKANALTAAMLEAVIEATDQAGRAGTGVLILTGVGKVFSAGADLEAAAAGLAQDPLWQQASDALAGFPGLTIAALNGTLAGGALGLALACDLRLAVQNAQFFYPVMRRGYLPQAADVARMRALIGPARSNRLLMAGAKIGADEALDWGLIDQILAPDTAPDALIAAALSLAGDAAEAPPAQVAAIKAMMTG